jgi:uncharacterized glyoxalase superfamily protein PhnB
MANNITGYKILLWSKNPDKLVEFYKNVLGLEQSLKLELEDDYGYNFVVGEHHSLWIGKHDKVSGKNKDTFRLMINLYVNDVFEWFEKLKKRKDVKIIAEPFVTPPTRGNKNPRYVFTFLDPEGNCLQCMNG